MIAAMTAVSFNLLLGYTGVVSFGHSAFFAIGAYTYVLTSLAGITPWLAMLLSPISTGVCAAIIGSFCVRLKWLYFAILTLAFNGLIWTVIIKSEFTGGENGMIGAPIPQILMTRTNLYFFVMLVGIAVLAIMWRIVNSPFGWALRTASLFEGNYTRSQFIGIDVRRYQLISFIGSSVGVGIGGMLLALFSRGAFPTFASVEKTTEILVWPLLGGMNYFFGPAVGAFTFIILSTYTNRVLGPAWPIVLGAVIIVIVLFSPRGIMGFLDARGRALFERPMRGSC